MKDWAGNKIDVGDIIKLYRFIRTVPISEAVSSSEACYENEKEKPSKYVWEFYRDYYVLPETGYSTFSTRDINAVAIDQITYIIPDENYALCIEGKSDSMEDFYMDFFKV